MRRKFTGYIPSLMWNITRAFPRICTDAMTVYVRRCFRDGYIVIFKYFLYMCARTHRCPPRAFIPALCKIFMDPQAPDNVLEVTSRAITYYLDVSVDCTRRITSIEGALKAIVERMQAADVSLRASKDLAEQCAKVCRLLSAPLGETCES